MKKKMIAVVMIALVLIVLSGLFAGKLWFEHNHVQIGTVKIPRDTTHLVLSSAELPSQESLLRLSSLQELDARNIPLTINQYEQLRATLPDCTILWQVPFQDTCLPESTRELTINQLSPSDFDSFRYLPELTQINAEGCTDYAALLQLKTDYPQLDVRYTVTVNGADFPGDSRAISLQDADLDALSAALPYLPQLQEISFTGSTPDNESIYQLMMVYPEISFQWELEIFGIKTPNTVTTLSLSDIPMEDTSEVESYLKYFPNLERVEMCDCGIPSEEMDALAQRHPDIRFVWTIKIRDGSLRTDAVAFIPFKLGYDLNKPLNDNDLKELKYCIDLVCLDLGHMKIRDISFLQYMPNMKYLLLVDMPCKDFSVLANLKELIYLELFNVQFTQHEVLLEMTKLEDLNISSTPTRDIDVLKQMTWLKRLWLVRTKLNGTQVSELSAALPDTQIVINALHSTDKGWRNNQNYRDMRDLLGMFYMD